MLQDKPYLNKDFRVSDVHAKLNIDRLKCNEIFSRAYKCYFRNWVLQYRIEYAIKLMKENPDKQVKEISFEAGLLLKPFCAIVCTTNGNVLYSIQEILI